MKVLVTFMIISLVSLTLGSQIDNNCPDPNDEREKLTPNTDSVKKEYEKRRSGKELDLTPDPDLIKKSEEAADKCGKPTFPDDKPIAEERSVSKRAIFLPRKCEPCPSTERFLGRFYGSCFVIWPQRVRYVTCPTRCFAPCMCSRSYCRKTAWSQIWFFSYCFGQNLPGGYRPGFNYRYLWLPQCCTCVNV